MENFALISDSERNERYSDLVEEETEESNNSRCQFWVDVTPSAKDGAFDSYTRFLEEDFLTDLTLLVGPNQVPIKVHRLVLAAHFEYFKSMISSGLKESMSTAFHLPFVGPEDFRLILNYAYSGVANLNKENIFKMAVMASYFGCDILTE